MSVVPVHVAGRYAYANATLVAVTVVALEDLVCLMSTM